MLILYKFLIFLSAFFPIASKIFLVEVIFRLFIDAFLYISISISSFDKTNSNLEFLK